MAGLDCDVAVVGAGPAGVAAALAVSERGADVVLVDEAARPGGQIWRGAVVLPAPLAELERSPVRLRPDTLVWGAAEATTLLLAPSSGAGQATELRAGALVIATGAYDRPLAFPGWTLPGVMTPGGAQALLKGSGVVPGRRAVVAGAGPFLPLVARNLAGAGVEVALVAEATRPRRWLAHGRRALRHPGKLAELAAMRGALRAAGVPVRLGRMVVRAEGDGRVERVVVAAVDGDWRPRPGGERTLDVDLLCVGFGFLPSLELAAALGCRVRWDARLGTHVVAAGADQGTTTPGVFAAGEATGVGGAALAGAEGSIAGANAARHAGVRGAAAPSRAALRARARQRHLAALLGDLFAAGDGAWELARDDTVVCRCEEVTLGTVRAAAASEPNALKVTTRAGMGRCQGRICGPLLAHAVGAPETAFSPRPPARPISLGTLAGVAREAAR